MKKNIFISGLLIPLLTFLVLFGGGVVFAQSSEGISAPVALRHKGLPQPGMLPTSPFYFLKRFSEAIGTLLTFGDENKAIRHFELAQKRLAEAEELAAQKKFDKAKPIFERYNKELEKTKIFLDRADLKGKDMSKLAERILEILPISSTGETIIPEDQRQKEKPSALEEQRQAEEALEKAGQLAPPPAQKGLQTAEQNLQKTAQKILVKKQSEQKTQTLQTFSQYKGSDKFGFCDGFKKGNFSEDIQDTKALGFLWGRPIGDVFAQETVEKNGTYNFSVPDKVVNEMQSAGIKIFGTLFPTGMPKIPNSIDTASFATYVKAIVEHYRGQITHWQVGIEPFCATAGETCYKNFFELTKTAYQAAKSVDPSIKISPGGPAPIYDMNSRIDPMSSGIFGYFFKNGGANYMDFFNFHYLVGKEEPSISKYVEYWKQYVDGKEIWLSETGSRDVGDRYTISSDENKEAEWVKQHITEAFQSGVSKVFWCRAEHSFSDMPNVVQALQEMAKKYGGVPSGSVSKRQSGAKFPSGQQPSGQQQFQQPGGMMQQQQGGMQQGGMMQQQQGGMYQGSGMMQQPGGFQQPGGMQQGGGMMQQGGGMMQQGGTGGYCGDSKCDSIEQQTGGCPQDCQ